MSEPSYRIHTFGASGSGTTTLARALAQKWGIPHFDADDYYWENTNPPFTTKRSVPERVRLLKGDLGRHPSWVLSGSMVSWGDEILGDFTHAIFLYIPPEIRLPRLLARERERYGARIEAGGDMEKIHCDLVEWAAKYDLGGLEVRSRKAHEEWMKKLACPILRIEEVVTTERQVEMISEKFGRGRESAG